MNQYNSIYFQLIVDLTHFLSEYPPLKLRDGRDAWLMNLPEGVRNLITRRSDHCNTDLSLIFDSLKSIQLIDSRWATLLLIDALLPDLKEVTLGKKLKELRDRLDDTLSKMETDKVDGTGKNAAPGISTKEDWGLAPDISIFFGRTNELETLEQWIVKDKCRLVAVLGMAGVGKTRLSVRLGKGGIGKTDLTLKVAQGIRSEFEYVIWRKLLDAPPITEILADVIKFISNQEEIVLPKSVDEQISRLLHYFQEHRCLLIFDNVESVLRGGEQAGLCRENYEGYGELFKRVGTTLHQSCLLLNSREKPKEIALQEGSKKPVRVLELGGLNETEVKQLFDETGSFTGSDKEWRELVKIYNGNPLALELAAKHISEVFFGNISMFLKKGKPIFNDLHELLDWHFQRLSDLEKEVLYWLAIDREPVSFSELEDDLLFPLSKEQLSSTLQLLQRRLPLEKSSSRFTLQPVLIEYMIDKLIERVIQDICTMEISLLDSHALLKALARDYVRETQSRIILKPINDRLLNLLGGQGKLESQFEQLLSKLREETPQKPGYAGGNILNLLCQQKTELNGNNFSQLAVWQAYLQETRLYGVNFASSNLKNCAFLQTFGPISSHAFSPDGKLIAASESNGDIHVWRVADMQILWTLRGHINWIFALTFSPDGQILASGGEDKTVRLWDISSGKCLSVLHEHTNSVWAVAFSPNSEILATGSEDETINIWNLHTGQLLVKLREHERKVFSLVFSPDGLLLASASADKTIKIWDVQNWINLKTLLGHEDTVRGVAFSSDGRFIGSGSWDRTIKIWDSGSGDCLKTLQGHTDCVHSIAFSPDGQILVSSDEAGTIKVWNIQTGTNIETLKRHVGEVWKIAFTADGQKLASGGYDGLLRIWDTEDWKCNNTLQGYIDWVQALDFSPDGKIIAASNGDLAIRIWDVRSGDCLRTFCGHTGWTFSVAFSPDGKRLASGSDDRTIKIWDTSTWKALHVFEGHANWVQTVAFSPDGKRLASGSDDRTVKIWDLSSGRCIQVLQGHVEGIWSVVFAPNGETLASGSEDLTIKKWNIASGECIGTYTGHTDRIHNLSLSPDGKLLATSSDDKTVKIWDFHTGNCLWTLEGHTSWVIPVDFSPSGQIVASGSKDNTVRLWDINTGKCINVLEGHIGGIWSIAFSHDGKTVASASEDGSIRIWDVDAGECLKILRQLKPYEGMDITNVIGLTDAQKSSLKLLGALEKN